MQARSLLTAHEDFTTLQFHAGTEIQRPGFVFSALKQRLDEAKVEEIKRICLTVDQKCAIFDVPSEHVKVRPALPSPVLHSHGTIGLAMSLINQVAHSAVQHCTACGALICNWTVPVSLCKGLRHY